MAMFAIREAAKVLWSHQPGSELVSWDALPPDERIKLIELAGLVISTYIFATHSDRDRDPA